MRPARIERVVSLGFDDEGAGTITFDADVPFVGYTGVTALQAIAVDEPVSGVVDAFTFEQLYTVELSAGDEVEISVRGAAPDPYYILLEPGEAYDPAAQPTADDGGGGLYDLDAVDTHTIDADGTYTVVVGTFDGIVSGYELLVAPAE